MAGGGVRGEPISRLHSLCCLKKRSVPPLHHQMERTHLFSFVFIADFCTSSHLAQRSKPVLHPLHETREPCVLGTQRRILRHQSLVVLPQLQVLEKSGVQPRRLRQLRVERLVHLHHNLWQLRLRLRLRRCVRRRLGGGRRLHRRRSGDEGRRLRFSRIRALLLRLRLRLRLCGALLRHQQKAVCDRNQVRQVDRRLRDQQRAGARQQRHGLRRVRPRVGQVQHLAHLLEQHAAVPVRQHPARLQARHAHAHQRRRVLERPRLAGEVVCAARLAQLGQQLVEGCGVHRILVHLGVQRLQAVREGLPRTPAREEHRPERPGRPSGEGRRAAYGLREDAVRRLVLLLRLCEVAGSLVDGGQAVVHLCEHDAVAGLLSLVQRQRLLHEAHCLLRVPRVLLHEPHRPHVVFVHHAALERHPLFDVLQRLVVRAHAVVRRRQVGVRRGRRRRDLDQLLEACRALDLPVLLETQGGHVLQVLPVEGASGGLAVLGENGQESVRLVQQVVLDVHPGQVQRLGSNEVVRHPLRRHRRQELRLAFLHRPVVLLCAADEVAVVRVVHQQLRRTADVRGLRRHRQQPGERHGRLGRCTRRRGLRRRRGEPTLRHGGRRSRRRHGGGGGGGCVCGGGDVARRSALQQRPRCGDKGESADGALACSQHLSRGEGGLQ
eukprot:Rhum_TRINITY_DN14737_c12_g1::Rhum_TRINITY_DN14737_c12_g1_i1::g.113659::m.113659